MRRWWRFLSSWCLCHLAVLWLLLSAVRVAEWSKAPDSRANLARVAGSKPSGPRMWAWVQIPPLTHFLFFPLFFCIFQAIRILQMLSWLTQSLEAYSVLSLILNHTLKQPLTGETIGRSPPSLSQGGGGGNMLVLLSAQMDEALTTFLSPEKPHPHQAHKDSIFNLARRYFFLLLRYIATPTSLNPHWVLSCLYVERRKGWLEKCLELGEQLKARDLVMVS